MATFQEKIDHACRVFDINTDELGTAIKINPFSLHLHATGQRKLDHSEMVRLCQYFDLMDTYFTNDNIRFIDIDTLPTSIRKLLPESENLGIMCYEVEDAESPDLSHEDLIGLFSAIVEISDIQK